MVAFLANAFRTTGHILLLLVLAGVGAWLNGLGFEQIERVRQIERIPPTEPLAILPGEVSLVGTVFAGERLVVSPRTRTPSVYYRYVLEEERRDSEGKKSWHTIQDRDEYAPFLLGNERARVPVLPIPGIRWMFDGATHTDREGKYRHTEYRIQPDHTVFVFGMAVRYGDRIEVEFHQRGRYTPIISRRTEFHERRALATKSVFSVWGSMVCLSLCVVTICSLLHIHRVFTYQSIVAGTICLGLVLTGLTMLYRDLRGAHDVLARHRTEAVKEFQRVLEAHGESWDGDFASFSGTDDPRFAGLDPLWRDRLFAIWVDLARATERTNRLRSAFPERWLAPSWGIAAEPPVAMPPDLAAATRDRESTFRPVQFSPPLGLLLVGVGTVAGLLLSYFGFRVVKVKRTIENIPTSSTRGVAYGLVELKGRAEATEIIPPLDGPISRTRCVQYHYTIKERRGSGKNQRWVTIHNESKSIPFYLVDDSGRIVVHTAGAEIITKHASSRREGRLQHHETSLRTGDMLYILGAAELNAQTMENLIIGRGAKEDPYIISNHAEEDILFSKGRSGLLVLNCSLNALILAALVGFALRGGFAATDYLASGLVAIFYLFVLLVFFMYNDLVFLRQLVRRNRANIDVSLRKRAELLPRLEAVVKGYMVHERELLTSITDLRIKYGGGALPNMQAIASFMEAEDAFSSLFLGRQEAYPDLKANEQVAALSRRLVELENEIALMRDGYNAIVRIYNTRVGTLPEAFLAKAFSFEEADYLRAATEVHRVPRVTLEATGEATGETPGEVRGEVRGEAIGAGPGVGATAT